MLVYINICWNILGLRQFWLAICPTGPDTPGGHMPKCLNNITSKCKPFVFLILYIYIYMDFGVQHIPVTDGSMKETNVSLQHGESKKQNVRVPPDTCTTLFSCCQVLPDMSIKGYVIRCQPTLHILISTSTPFA